MKKLVVYYSKSGNTKKIAEVIAKELKCKVISIDKVKASDLDVDLIGFGAGIYAFKPHKKLMKFVKNLDCKCKKCFIFSTSGAGKGQMGALNKLLEKKGFKVIDKFACKGEDTFFVTRLFGVSNKGKPDKEEFKQAKEFCKKIKN